MRRILTIHITSEFKKSLRKLPMRIQILTEKKDKMFRSDAFNSRLDTHKLKGELDGYWSYSVNKHYRVLFRFITDHEVIYYDVGTHNIYK